MTSWLFSLSEVMGDTSKYLAYVVNVKRINDQSWRSYVSGGDEIELIEACYDNCYISLSKIDILRIKF